MFRLTGENRSWFQGISKNFKNNFDMYYLCLLMGLASNYKGDVPDKGDLITYWPDEGNYAGNQNFIIGLILFLEAKNMGVDIKEKSKTTKLLNNYIDPDSFSKLSSKAGFREANRYASGGCEIMKDNIQKPNLFGVFLKKYHEELTKQIQNNRHFNF
tara:strand:- start:305 stop:775 length:471 start_codon:yes stop_codon:yes gene_type:complete